MGLEMVDGLVVHRCDNEGCGGVMEETGRACGADPWIERLCRSCGRTERDRSGGTWVMSPGRPAGLGSPRPPTPAPPPVESVEAGSSAAAEIMAFAAAEASSAAHLAAFTAFCLPGARGHASVVRDDDGIVSVCAQTTVSASAVLDGPAVVLVRSDRRGAAEAFASAAVAAAEAFASTALAAGWHASVVAASAGRRLDPADETTPQASLWQQAGWAPATAAGPTRIMVLDLAALRPAPPEPSGDRACPDCGAVPGETHRSDDCDVARCTICGWQRLGCDHGDDPRSAGHVWTGRWPGDDEVAEGLAADLNDLACRAADGELVWDGQRWRRPAA